MPFNEKHFALMFSAGLDTQEVFAKNGLTTEKSSGTQRCFYFLLDSARNNHGNKYKISLP